MNFRIKNRKLLNADIISPEIVYAEFSSELVESQAECMVNAMNNGHDMLLIYKEMRDDMHIVNVMEMLNRMERIYAKWVEREYQIQRKTK